MLTGTRLEVFRGLRGWLWLHKVEIEFPFDMMKIFMGCIAVVIVLQSECTKFRFFSA